MSNPLTHSITDSRSSSLHAVREFRKILGQRKNALGDRMTIGRMAAEAVIGRSHLSQILHGKRRGRETRALLFPHLTEDEVRVLGGEWWGDYEKWRRFHGEHCSKTAA